MKTITRITINIEKLAEQENSYKNLLELIEPVYLSILLQKNDGNKSQAARMAALWYD